MMKMRSDDFEELDQVLAQLEIIIAKPEIH